MDPVNLDISSKKAGFEEIRKKRVVSKWKCRIRGGIIKDI